MRISLLFVTFFLVLFVHCSKSGSSTPVQTAYISISNVTLARMNVNTTATFVVSVDPSSAKAITVNYTTVAGTAKANDDFVPLSGTLTFSPNTTRQEIVVQVLGKDVAPGSQEFYVQLSNPSGATLKFDKGTATLQNTAASYQLVWSDEFNDTALNTADWNYETGGGGWGNNELQNYTAGTNNAYLQGGNLVIEAKKESLGGYDYTSARLTTKGKKKFTYGKVDIRAKIPLGKGIWPALWMLGENINTVGWPSCGEIDIMEFIGETNPSKVYGTAHWGLSSAAHLYKGGNLTLGTGNYSDDFHIYSIEWTSGKIQWFIDNVKFYELTRADITGGNFPFDKDFFFIMNVAVGGNWPGNPDATTVFPQKMLVDYIKVYQK